MSQKLLDTFGISQEDAAEVEAQRAPSEGINPGVYNATVKDAYVYHTDGGADMLELVLSIDNDGEERDVYHRTCVKSKAGKTTYNKDGKDYLLPGVAEMIRLSRLYLGTENPDVKKEFVQRKDQPTEVLVLPDMRGKKIKVGIKQEKDWYNNSEIIKPVVVYWMKADGTDENGEVIEDKVARAIDKNPVRETKQYKNAKNGPTGTAPTPAAGTTTPSAVGW